MIRTYVYPRCYSCEAVRMAEYRKSIGALAVRSQNNQSYNDRKSRKYNKLTTQSDKLFPIDVFQRLVYENDLNVDTISEVMNLDRERIRRLIKGKQANISRDFLERFMISANIGTIHDLPEYHS